MFSGPKIDNLIKKYPDSIILTDEKDVPLDGEQIILDDHLKRMIAHFSLMWNLNFQDTLKRIIHEALESYLVKDSESATTLDGEAHP